MKILFLDSPTCSYDTTTHLKQPLGGTQSAVSCLTKALAQMGHEITVINGIAEDIETDGVHFTHLPCPIPFLNEFDVVVPVSGAMGQVLRNVGCSRPLVLWAHHAGDQPSVQQLHNPEERSIYTGFAHVSQWQANSYIATFGLDPSRIKVLRNAVSPVFLQTTPAASWLQTGSPPVLGYSSTPYRGLDALLLSFASIRRQIEGATLLVFSSMGIYGPNVQDDYSSLYDLAHALPGVTYVGPLPQARLAEAMAKIDIWAYPCSFAETSCISAMEAMASGNMLVSTTLGALPETTAGFAHLIDLTAPQTPGMRATAFAGHLVKTANEALANPQAAQAGLARQIEYVRAHYDWKIRAIEWIEWLERIL
jgi:glycosyltransferase involved in cell wall biosynthesis